MNDLLLISASELARRIRSGAITSRAAVEAHITQIEVVNPAMNAVVRERFALARAEADAADRAIAAGQRDLPEFHGVPCTIKESFALQGMPNSAGLVARKDHIAPADCVTVARMRRAGFIPLGVTNTSELCMWMESHNHVYGRTGNPYDSGRIVGGSSGGEGAIVGSGASPVGLGSDIGGSIRMPAFFNGVFGHKPTGGLVPGSGQYPPPHDVSLQRMLATGPLTRRAEDLMPVLRLLAGPDDEDEACVPFELRDPAAVSIAGLRVLSVEGNGFRKVNRALRDAQHRAGQALKGAGATVEVTRIPRLKRSLDIWASRMSSSAGPSYRSLLGHGKEVNPVTHLLRAMAGRSPHTLPSIGLALAELLPFVTRKEDPRATALRHELRAELDALLGDNGVMLYPSYTRPAPKHGAPLLTPLDWTYTAVMNAMELPVTQVPLGLGDDGLPLGVQVVAPFGRDDLSIAVAIELERAMGGWVPPWAARASR